MFKGIAWKNARAIQSLLFVVLSVVVSLPCRAETADTSPIDAAPLRVRTNTGAVDGQIVLEGAARRWLGIPYAEPPIGTLRWQPPRPHPAWREPLNASAYGAACSQVGWLYGPPAAGKSWGVSNVETFGKPVGSEDCLTLNLWRPNTPDTGLPVIVFIHGGANIVGHSSDPIYDGARLAAKTRSLVVTINYRLGLFGWLSHPALEGDDPLGNSGNFGILDIIEALRFVKANAAAFGGDPDAVTVMGESAGGGDIYALMGSPLTVGLFHKAIVQSALIRKGYRKEEGAAYVKRFAARLLIRDRQAADEESALKLIGSKGDEWLKTYLLGKPASDLLDTQSQHDDLWKVPGFFGDGAVLPPVLSAAFEQGAFQKMPMIVGMTREESKLLFNAGLKLSGQEQFKAMVNADPDTDQPIALDEFVSPYLLPSWSAVPFNTMHRAFSRYLRHELDGDLTVLAKYNPNVFAYRFEWNQGPEPWRTLFGSSHGSDLPFVFGNFAGNLFSMEYSEKTRRGREALSDAMMSSIGAFIRSGDPNNEALGLSWRPWTSALGDKSRLNFDAADTELRLSTGR